MFKTLLKRTKHQKKKDSPAQLISVKELTEDAGKQGHGEDQDPMYDVIQDPGDKRLSINGLSSFKVPDGDVVVPVPGTDAGGDTEPLYATVNKGTAPKKDDHKDQINGENKQDDMTIDDFGDLTAFIESIVADMNVAGDDDDDGNAGDEESEASSSEEMKLFGTRVMEKKSPLKAVSEPNLNLNEAGNMNGKQPQNKGTNHTKDTSRNYIDSTSFPTTGPLLQQRATSGMELSRATSMNGSSPTSAHQAPGGGASNHHPNAADYHFDVRPKKSVSFNDVVQERPQSLVSEDAVEQVIREKSKEAKQDLPKNKDANSANKPQETHFHDGKTKEAEQGPHQSEANQDNIRKSPSHADRVTQQPQQLDNMRDPRVSPNHQMMYDPRISPNIHQQRLSPNPNVHPRFPHDGRMAVSGQISPNGHLMVPNGHRRSPSVPNGHPNGHLMLHRDGYMRSPSVPNAHGAPLLMVSTGAPPGHHHVLSNGLVIPPEGRRRSSNGLLTTPHGRRMSPNGLHMVPNVHYASLPHQQKQSPHLHRNGFFPLPPSDRRRASSHDDRRRQKYKDPRIIGSEDRRITANDDPRKRSYDERMFIMSNDDRRVPYQEEQRRGSRSPYTVPPPTPQSAVPPDAEAEECPEVRTITSGSKAPDEDCVSVGSDGGLYSDSEDEEEEEIPPPTPAKVRSLAKTRVAMLLLAWFAMGLMSQTHGSAGGMPYFLSRMDLTFRTFSLSLLARGGGMALGAVLGGVLGACVNGYLDGVMFLGLMIGGAALTVAPWCPGLPWLCGAAAGDGLARGILSVGGVLYAIRLWGAEKGCLLIHLLHISFAVGSAILPQIVRPVFDDSNTDTIEQYLHIVGMDGILSYNGFEIVLNGSKTVLLRHERPVATTPLPVNVTAGMEGVGEDQGQVMVARILFLLLGIVVMFIGAVFIGLGCYVRVQRCRRSAGEARMREYEERRLQAKIATDRKEQEKEKQKEINGMVTAVASDSKKTDDEPESGTKNEEQHEKETPVDNEKTEDKKDNGDDAEKVDSERNSPEGSTPEDKHEDTDDDNAADKPKTNGHSVKFDIDETKEAKKEAKAHAKAAKKKKKKTKTKDQMWFQGDQSFDVPMLMYLYVFFSLPLGAEVTISTFVFTYATDAARMNMTPLFASFLISMFWTAMALSRIFAMSVSKYISPNAVMVSLLTLGLLSASLLAAYGHHVLTVLWLLTGMTGATIGPILPGGFTWANLYLNYNPRALSLAFGLASLGAMLFPWITGFLVDFYGISVVMYVLVAIQVLALLLYIPAMRGLGVRKMFKMRMKRTRDLVLLDSQKTYV